MFNDNCSLTCKNTPWFPEATLQQSGCSSSGVQFGPYFLLLGAPPLCSLWHSLGHPSYQMIQLCGGTGPNPAVCSVEVDKVSEERKLEQVHFHHICRNGFYYTCWSCSLSPSLRKVKPAGCLCWVTSAWAAMMLTSVKSWRVCCKASMQGYWHWWEDKNCKKYYSAVLSPSRTHTPQKGVNFLSYFTLTLDLVTIDHFNISSTSSPRVAASAAMVLQPLPPLALFLHILMHKWKVSEMKHWLLFRKMLTPRQDIWVHVITV